MREDPRSITPPKMLRFPSKALRIGHPGAGATTLSPSHLGAPPWILQGEALLVYRGAYSATPRKRRVWKVSHLPNPRVRLAWNPTVWMTKRQTDQRLYEDPSCDNDAGNAQ